MNNLLKTDIFLPNVQVKITISEMTYNEVLSCWLFHSNLYAESEEQNKRGIGDTTGCCSWTNVNAQTLLNLRINGVSLIDKLNYIINDIHNWRSRLVYL